MLRHRRSPPADRLADKTMARRRQSWPDPSRRRQESPTNRRHATPSVQVSREWAKERSSWSAHYGAVLVFASADHASNSTRRRSQISAVREGHRLAALLYFAAVPGS
jgi:hypothetical protein